MTTSETDVRATITEFLQRVGKAAEFDSATRLFADGLGLDSIDVLELVLEIERSFGVAITDEETGVRVLRSVDTIAEFILAAGPRKPQ